MKTIGLIGGMSWESSDLYYQLINKQVAETQGGLHSAKIILYSVNFHEIEKLQSEGNWSESAKILSGIALKLESIGADVIGLCTNTMHLVADHIQNSITVPFLHIAEAVAEKINAEHKKTVLLLGTTFTMQKEFYKEKLLKHGIDVVVPEIAHQEIINSVIYTELCKGKVLQSSKDQYIEIINANIKRGIEGVILGCTEIGMLIENKDLNIPIYDSTEIHASKLVKFILE